MSSNFQIVRVLFQFGMMRKRERKKILMNQKLTSIRFSWTKINKSEKVNPSNAPSLLKKPVTIWINIGIENLDNV